MPSWSSSDHEFTTFLESVAFDDLSFWEQDAYLFKKENPGQPYSQVEQQIAAYARKKAS